MKRVGDGRRILVVGPGDGTVGGTVDELASAVSFDVEGATDAVDAIDVLAHPETVCLVYLGEPETRMGRSFARRLLASYPTTPVVLVGDFPEETDADALALAETSSESPTDIAATAERLVDRRESGRDMEAIPSGEATRWPNVDADRLDGLLAEGVDREHLGELLHKSQLFDELFDRIPAHMFVKDERGKHLYISRKEFGDLTELFEDRADPEVPLVTPEHKWRAHEDDRYVIETGREIRDKEECLVNEDTWNHTSKAPWHGPDGDIVGIIGVSIPITERKRRQQQVRQQNERLQEFASVVSHDLRNPLQVASSYLAALATDTDDERVSKAQDALGRMDDIIEDVLSLARAGRTETDDEKVDLEAVAMEAWKLLEVEGATLSVELDGATVRGDRLRLARVFGNLFANADEHGGGDVSITVGRIDDGFFVADDGAGIPETERDRVREAGYTNSREGTGFGMAIVARIADAHGWEMHVTDSAEGGARIEFTGVEFT